MLCDFSGTGRKPDMKKALMYGAGNIGRGFIGQVFSKSGYEVVFIDVNKEIIAALNAAHEYPVDIISTTGTIGTVVSPVRAVDGMDIESVSSEIATADIMATAVGVHVLPHIVKPIVAGLKRRWAQHNTAPLNIIICENLINANTYLAELICKELSGTEITLFHDTIALVEASIGRMVPVMTETMRKGNLLRVCVEEYDQLPVDKDAFKGPLPVLDNMVPFSPFKFYIQRKLFIHNLGHGITAYLGHLQHYQYVWEAVNNPWIKLVALNAMLESAMALSLEHHVHPATIIAHIHNLLVRFGNTQLGDTIERVGKDPLRKLSHNDRLAGALHLCKKQSLPSISICLGIAAALCFDNQSDPAAVELADQIKRNGLNKTIIDLCGIASGSKELNDIIRFHAMLKDRQPLQSILNELDLSRDKSAKTIRA